MYLHYVRGMRPDVTLIEVALLAEPWYLRTLERHRNHVYSDEMGILLERALAGRAQLTSEEYRRLQIGLIVDMVYPSRPVYFGSTVEHALLAEGYKVYPSGLLYRVVRNDDPPPVPPAPHAYQHRDIAYADYNADKIRNVYMTMLYAGGIWAERLGMSRRALEYYEQALSFFPASDDLVSHHREGDYLRTRRQDVERARQRLLRN